MSLQSDFRGSQDCTLERERERVSERGEANSPFTFLESCIPKFSEPLVPVRKHIEKRARA